MDMNAKIKIEYDEDGVTSIFFREEEMTENVTDNEEECGSLLPASHLESIVTESPMGNSHPLIKEEPETSMENTYYLPIEDEQETSMGNTCLSIEEESEPSKEISHPHIKEWKDLSFEEKKARILGSRTKKRNRNICVFAGCGKCKHKYPNLRFFYFPVIRPSICELWIKNCANERLATVSKKSLNRRVVCEEHFESDCFVNDMKTRLRPCAVPTKL